MDIKTERISTESAATTIKYAIKTDAIRWMKCEAFGGEKGAANSIKLGFTISANNT